MDNEKQEYNSFYRGFVVNNRDPDKKQKVLVWIPDVMPNVPQDQGLWAKPANNPMGGRNNEFDEGNYYQGTSYIPRKGSYVWVFFECGNINRPYYFGALEPGNTKVLPECQVGDEYEHKWVIFKSSEGRCVVISDDPSDRRVEITGKKRELKNPPNGDTDSVYKIDDNQSTILFDEREGKEKILIRTHKGDYFHIDVDERKMHGEFDESINLKTKKFSLQGEEVHIKSSKGTYYESEGEFHNKAAGDYYVESGETLDIKSYKETRLGADANVSINSGGTLAMDGEMVLQQQSASVKPNSAKGSDPDDPEGERDT